MIRKAFAVAAIASLVAAIGACAAQPSIDAMPSTASQPLVPLNVSPNTYTSPIPLALGMPIGTNVFPDGDTATGGQGQKMDGQFICKYQWSMAFSVWAHLSIFDSSGKQIMVPEGIGDVAPWTFTQTPAGQYISRAKCGYNIMTIDRTGIIVVCAPTPFSPTLGELFDFWGMPLSTTNVAGYTGTVWVKLHHRPSGPDGNWTSSIDPRSIVLTNGLQVTLAVGSPVNPVPIYSHLYGN